LDFGDTLGTPNAPAASGRRRTRTGEGIDQKQVWYKDIYGLSPSVLDRHSLLGKMAKRHLKSLSSREYGFESHRPHQHLVGIVCHDALPLAPLATSLKISLYKRSPERWNRPGPLVATNPCEARHDREDSITKTLTGIPPSPGAFTPTDRDQHACIIGNCSRRSRNSWPNDVTDGQTPLPTYNSNH